jgi:hypothetical protein
MALSPGLAAVSSVKATSTQGNLNLVSVGTYEGNDIYSGRYPVVSDNGRYVAFVGYSSAANGAYVQQFFIHDTVTKITEIASVNNSGERSDRSLGGGASKMSISSDGRYLAFVANSNNLVDNDTNGVSDIFVRDIIDNETTRVSVSSSGNQANGSSDQVAISGNGRYVVFSSSADNLVANDTNNTSDVFVHDTQTSETNRISVNSDGEQGICTYTGCSNPRSTVTSPDIVSYDGRYVLFNSGANNLTEVPPYILPSGAYGVNVQAYIRDTVDNTTTLVSETYDGTQSRYGGIATDLSDDGTYVVFNCSSSANGCGFVPEGDSGIGQIYVRDMINNVNSKVSVNSSGEQGNGHSYGAKISDNGKTIVFLSSANNLVPNDNNGTTDIFLHDLATQTIAKISSSFEGGDSNGQSNIPSMSSDGRFVVFDSTASNLSPDDTNSLYDVFLVDRFPDSTAPMLGEPAWTANPITVGNNTSFSVPAIDDVSGVETGEYFIGTDPGVGNATSLTWDGTNLNSDSFGSNLEPGVYKIGIRAQDVAGNWSDALTAYLVVFDPDGPGYITGTQNITPDQSTGDILPWYSSAPQDFLNYGFNLEFTSTGTINLENSHFGVTYQEKGSCSNPNTPDCRIFELTAEDFDWFAISGTNSSYGVFQGTATLNINGYESTVPFRVEATDGGLLSPIQSDSFTLKIYPEGSNPQTTEPQYFVSAEVGNGNSGSVKIK